MEIIWYSHIECQDLHGIINIINCQLNPIDIGWEIKKRVESKVIFGWKALFSFIELFRTLLYNLSLFGTGIFKCQDTSRLINFLAIRKSFVTGVHFIFFPQRRASRIRDDKTFGCECSLIFSCNRIWGNVPAPDDRFAEVTGCQRDANFFSRGSTGAPHMKRWHVYAYVHLPFLSFLSNVLSYCNYFINKTRIIEIDWRHG